MNHAPEHQFDVRDGDPGIAPAEGDSDGDPTGALWDPLGAWPAGRRWLWVVLGLLACALQGPDFIKGLRPSREMGADFFQEWASAKNLAAGLPVYADHRVTMQRYLGLRVDPGEKLYIEVNAHPPTSVLLALPLAGLPYQDAVLVWNLASLALFGVSLGVVARQLRLPLSAWSFFPGVTLALLCNPLRQQVLQGQLNLVLLLLVVGVWAADRSGKDRWAGVILGLATAVKLFPGFLVVYLLVRKKWGAVLATVLSFLAVSALTAAVLGTQAYRDYALNILPRLEGFRDEYGNASLAGVWSKLLNTRDVEVQQSAFGLPDGTLTIAWIHPLARLPALARIGTLISWGVVLAVLLSVLRRCRSRVSLDLGFGLTLTAMLLVSPITWDHYFLLLLIPLAVIWQDLPESNVARVAFLVLLVGLCVNPSLVWDATIPLRRLDADRYMREASPVHTLTALSYQCYVLLGLFAYIAILERQRFRRAGSTATCC